MVVWISGQPEAALRACLRPCRRSLEIPSLRCFLFSLFLSHTSQPGGDAKYTPGHSLRRTGGVCLYRAQRNYDNLNRASYEGVGAYDMPQIDPEYIYSADQVIGFNYAKTCKNPVNTGVHFFLDDYQFSRLWTNPGAYIELLRRFKFVFTPDFSLYADYPKAVQIFASYKSTGSARIGRKTISA